MGGIVLGLGAQNLVRDFLGGVFLLIEHHYGVGDWVTISRVTGKVERITLRITQMRDMMGNVHIVPNGEIKQVTNLTREWSQALLDVGVAYKENVDFMMDVLRGIGAEMEPDEAWGSRLLEPLEVMGVQDFAESAVVIRIRYKTRSEARSEIMRELRRRRCAAHRRARKAKPSVPIQERSSPIDKPLLPVDSQEGPPPAGWGIRCYTQTA